MKLDNKRVILTEGSINERLRRNPGVRLDPYLVNAGLIYDKAGKIILKKLYRGYIDTGKRYNLPIFVYTPTWRANAERIRKAGYDQSADINGDSYRFLSGIRDEYGEYSREIYIGGLIGTKGNAYNPDESLSTSEAKSFHRFQVEKLTKAGVDFLIAQTLPAVDEAVGIAGAMAESGLSYILSFIIQPDGTLLDNTPLHQVTAKIDNEVRPKPYFYTVNCVHPSVFMAAMEKEYSQSKQVITRIIGLQGNTSCKSPKELENLPYLDTEAPGTFAKSMLALHQRFGTRVLGGCCGTDNNHIAEIAGLLCQ